MYELIQCNNADHFSAQVAFLRMYRTKIATFGNMLRKVTIRNEIRRHCICAGTPCTSSFYVVNNDEVYHLVYCL